MKWNLSNPTFLGQRRKNLGILLDSLPPVDTYEGSYYIIDHWTNGIVMLNVVRGEVDGSIAERRKGTVKKTWHLDLKLGICCSFCCSSFIEQWACNLVLLPLRSCSAAKLTAKPHNSREARICSFIFPFPLFTVPYGSPQCSAGICDSYLVRPEFIGYEFCLIDVLSIWHDLANHRPWGLLPVENFFCQTWNFHHKGEGVDSIER